MFRRILLTLLMVFFAVPAESGELRIMDLALAPYSYEEDGRVRGLLHDLGDALAREAGMTPRGRLVRLVRAVEELSMGRADLVLMLPTEAVMKVADDLGPIFGLETVAIGRRGANFRTVEALRGRTVAAIRGARYDARISAENGIIVSPAQNYLHAFKMLLGNRVDAVIGPRFGLMFTVREAGLPADRFDEPLSLSTVQVCVFVAKRSGPELAERLRKALARLRSNGTVEAVLARYAPH